ELRRTAPGAAAVRGPAQWRNPLLQCPALGEARAHRLGPASLPVRRLGHRCAGKAEVRPVLRQEPRTGLRFHDPAADRRGRPVPARRALIAPECSARGAEYQSWPPAAAVPPQLRHEEEARMAATESLVREFIANTFPTDGDEYPGDTDLLQAGIIDSIGVLTLV